MTKGLVEGKMMTDDERTIFVVYQYAGSAVFTNSFDTGAALLPINVQLFISVGICVNIIEMTAPGNLELSFFLQVIVKEGFCCR